MTASEKIEIAEREHIKAVGTIKRILDLKRGNSSYSTEYSNALYNFESALQGVLIYAALGIGKITANAAEFIERNHISGDIFREINSIGKRKLFAKWVRLDWTNIFDNDVNPDLLLEIVSTATANSVQNFVFPLSSVDSDITAKDYAAEISEYVKRIIQAFCSPDIIFGETEKNLDSVLKTMDGITAGIKVFNDAFLAYWKGSDKID